MQTYARTQQGKPLFEVMCPAAVLEFPQLAYVWPPIEKEAIKQVKYTK